MPQPSLAALARGPLGVIVAICTVCEVGLGVAVRSAALRPGTATFLVIAMALLAFVLLVGFLYGWLFAPLGRLYPWFNDALAQRLLELNIPVFGSTPLGQWVAGNVFEGFVQRLQDARPHEGDSDWSQFRPDKWEHTRWLHEDMLRNELQPTLLDDAQSRLPASPTDEMNEKMLLRIIGRESRFVALVDGVGAFIRLYDRRRLFTTYQKRIARSELMEGV